MIIVLKSGATEKQIKHVVEKVEELGLKAMLSKGVERTIIGVIGDEEILRVHPVEAIDGVEKVMPVLQPYKLVSSQFKPQPSIINIDGNIKVGGKQLSIIAGPCSVEGRDMVINIAKQVKAAGAVMLRGGAFKPRTSPYSFQGLGEDGLKFLAEAREATGLKIVTELMDTKDIPLLEKYADVIQIGARNMQNFNLLKAVGSLQKPVLLKRGIASTIKELLMSAEYILSQGNFNVILCERGIRTFEDYTRNTLDLSAVPVIKSQSHLPVIVDPSHGTGRRDLILPLSRAAVACGADGLMIEVHSSPEDALSDGEQSILPADFKKLVDEVKLIAKSVGRSL